MSSWVLCLLALSPAAVVSLGEDDLVTNLPGLTFQPNFKVYSGFLNANDNGTWQMHYWLTESRGNATTDPLLLWFNGGPGCSSFCGMFEELGPFYVTNDGQSLFENVHSWNQRANVLALESPIGVGFSYDRNTPGFSNAFDDQTAAQNYAALKDFFARVQTQYAGRDFYLAGESYAGVYIPTLSKLLVDGINAGSFPNTNFKGFAIGNGFMHVPALMNSLVLWAVYHGRLSVEDWDTVKATCGTPGATDADHFNYTAYLTSKNGMDFVSDGTTCGNFVGPLLVLDKNMDQYNYYQDCYGQNSVVAPNPSGKPRSAKPRNALLRRQRTKRYADSRADTSNNPTYNQYTESTDNQNGYPCWNEDAVHTYANRADVMKAIHIPQEWIDRKAEWIDCNDPIYDQYHVTYSTTNDLFDYILTNYKSPLRILIFNGDADTVCNYLGDAWLMRDVAAKANLNVTLPHQQWYFRNQTAGYVQRYGSANDAAGKTIDVVSVKGAGHFVPNDRPGQSAQMITNFVWGVGSSANGGVDYNDISLVNPKPDPLPLINPPETSTQASGVISSLIALAALALGVLARF